MDYLVETDHLIAFIYARPDNTNNDIIAKLASALRIREFEPVFDVRYVVTDVHQLSRIQCVLPSAQKMTSSQGSC